VSLAAPSHVGAAGHIEDARPVQPPGTATFRPQRCAESPSDQRATPALSHGSKALAQEKATSGPIVAVSDNIRLRELAAMTSSLKRTRRQLQSAQRI